MLRHHRRDLVVRVINLQVGRFDVNKAVSRRLVELAVVYCGGHIEKPALATLSLIDRVVVRVETCIHGFSPHGIQTDDLATRTHFAHCQERQDLSALLIA